MKKYIALLLGILLLPFIVRPSNVVELYAPFYEDQYLLAAAIMPEADDIELFHLSWPSWFIRLVASNHDFNFSMNFEDSQSKLQFILAALFEHEERKSSVTEMEYVLSMAQRSIKEGSGVDNVAGYGLSALHEAVLFNSVAAAELLFRNGAQCNTVVSRTGKPIDGMGALEMAEFLSAKSDKNRTEMLAYLNSQKCNKSKHSEL